MDTLQPPSKSSRKRVPRKSVMFLDMQHLEPGLADETSPLLFDSWTSDEETSDLSDAAVLNIQDRANARESIWSSMVESSKSILESRPLTLSRRDRVFRVRRTMIGIAPHILEGVDDTNAEVEGVRKFFSYYDLFCANFWIVLQICSIFSITFVSDVSFSLWVQWIFALSMTVYCVIATGWIETTWDVLIACYCFTFRYFMWAMPGTFRTQLGHFDSFYYIVGDLSCCFGALLFMYAYCGDQSESIKDLFFGSIAFGIGAALFLVSTVFASFVTMDEDFNYALWIAVVANSSILAGRVCFARSSWFASMEEVPEGANTKRNTIMNKCRQSIEELYKVQELWRSGSLTGTKAFGMTKSDEEDIQNRLITIDEVQKDFVCTDEEV